MKVTSPMFIHELGNPEVFEARLGRTAPARDAQQEHSGTCSAALMLRLQKSAGNRAAVGLVNMPLGRPESSLQRITGVEAAGLVMGAVSLADGVPLTKGGLSYQCDQLSFPADQQPVSKEAHSVSVRAAEFLSKGRFSDNHTVFNLHGDFGQGVLSNVHIDLDETTTYFRSELSFRATGMNVAYGTADDPRLRFVCTGRFDPVGRGDATFRAVLEVDRGGNVYCIESKFVNGSGRFLHSSGRGFSLEL